MTSRSKVLAQRGHNVPRGVIDDRRISLQHFVEVFSSDFVKRSGQQITQFGFELLQDVEAG